MATATETTAPALTRRSALELARAIRAGEVSSRAVLEEHLAVVERRNPELNAIVAERFEAARDEADAADARIAAATKDEELPPLLGVPCTIKESFAVEGMPNSSGLLARGEFVATATAVAPARLATAGAIPIGVTNTSELTLWIESVNRVHGRTSNAYDSRRTAGGSSGGEGTSVGAGFVPIGLGTDFGGSIRLPAFFNGVFGHKPTGCLVPHTGHFPVPTLETSLMLGVGPLARRAEDLMPVLRAIAGPDGEDESVREVELGDPAAVPIEGLEVTVAEQAWVGPMSRELLAARERAAGALAGARARVRRLDLRTLRWALQPYLLAVRESGSLGELLQGDGPVPPRFRSMAAEAARRRSPHTAPILLTFLAEGLSVRIPASIQRRIAAHGRRLAHAVEEAIGEGVLLIPPFARVAPRHGRTVGRPWLLQPSAVFNLLGLPVTQVPLGLDRRGLPLGVQVAAGRDRDHVAIAVALELERAFGGWVPPPGR